MDKKETESKFLFLDGGYSLIDGEHIIETKHCVSIFAMALYEDLVAYRKGNKDLKEQIELEIESLKAFTEASKAI